MDNKIILVISIIAILFLGSLGFTGYTFWNKESPDMLGNCELLSADDYQSSDLNGDQICQKLGYNRCFSVNKVKSTTYFETSDNTCSGKQQDGDLAFYTIECGGYESGITPSCETNPVELFGEPLAGDIETKRMTRSIICCKK
ncbi:MAG TPA: hypothetical protein VJB89_00750 [Candidatus Nanoarchaeia archaeon]|nr:hypothetical protein [Candidatus Nanoarchaeia archaeon]